jgi:hypothetical protein
MFLMFDFSEEHYVEEESELYKIAQAIVEVSWAWLHVHTIQSKFFSPTLYR